MCEKKQENLTLGDIYRNISKEASGSMKWWMLGENTIIYIN